MAHRSSWSGARASLVLEIREPSTSTSRAMRDAALLASVTLASRAARHRGPADQVPRPELMLQTVHSTFRQQWHDLITRIDPMKSGGFARIPRLARSDCINDLGVLRG